jgi:hypothetical protein
VSIGELYLRPTRHPQSGLRAPLNHLLGREAAVRLLRVLALRREPISRAELAREAALDPAGARRALAALGDSGILEESGSARDQHIRLRPEHPLTSTIRVLFADERRLATATLDAIRRAVGDIRPPLRAAWLIEPLASTSTDAGSPPVVAVLTSSKYAGRTRDAVDRALADVAKQTGTPLELQLWTEPDLAAVTPHERETLARGLPLLGPPPSAWLTLPDRRKNEGSSVPALRTHADLDDRSLLLARAVAAKLARDPHLIEQARQALSRRLLAAAPAERATLQEWHQILRTLSPPQVRRLLVDPGPRATRLRQSLPFTDVLTSQERTAALGKARNRRPASR